MADLKPADKEAAAKQAALDKAAAEAQAKAEAEAKDLAKAEAVAEKAEAKAEDFGEPRAMRCPDCNARMERYTGDNPHKIGSQFCPNHGRVWIEHGKILR